jgi:pyruvate,water dikinase
MHSSDETRWSTVNFGEAIGGVQTPLSWAIWTYGMEVSARRAFASLGILTRREEALPASADDRMSGIFYGRAAGNINFFRMVGDRTPGSAPDVIEQKLFGEVSGAPVWGGRSGPLRSAVIAAKFPLEAFKAPRASQGVLDEQRRWWRRNAVDSPPQTLEQAQALVRDAAERFADVCVGHTVVSMIGPQLLETLAGLAQEATGDPGLGTELASGYGGMEETAIIADLWAAAQGSLDIAEIQRRHGFHGPDEGRLDTRSWREDPAPVEAILRGYRKRDIADPRGRERDQIARREAATARVLAGLPAWKRPGAKLAMKLASIYIPAREMGKAAFLHALDGGRCGARVAAAILHDRGLLADPEDVFFLTLDELTGSPDRSFLEITAERKANHLRYLGLELPRAWNGVPEPIVIAPAPDTPSGAEVTSLRGIGVVGRKVTGRARVVTDPSTVEFEDGDILVCSMTDPSWTPLFMLADGLVIDTGGQMSHGAIVARELGVTCVINTVTGTRDIPEGATITVDGSTGVVEILG